MTMIHLVRLFGAKALRYTKKMVLWRDAVYDECSTTVNNAKVDPPKNHSMMTCLS